ncbi:MAG: DUF72 domain-containing protein [Gammaproteobacteria bacterium]|nr:DUF72 domain-containing protein [Gammaproteobacteria bacterium]
MQVDWLAGTSGYSYKAWKGSFYPEDLAAADMLAFYASKLPAVEINNTFYRMPRRSVLETWRDSVPASFRFSIKASRRITHQARLQNCEEAVEFLATGLETLGEKLGCVLFQLPPYLRKDDERLDAFLSVWPKAFPAAMEFRHASWFDDETAETLARHDAAICLSEDGELPMPGFLATTDWLYLRLRKPDYDNEALASWIARGEGSDAARAFAFFKHEDEGAGPALANRFLDLADSTLPSPQ